MRRPSSRRSRRWHPDLDHGSLPDRALTPTRTANLEVAVDFVDMGAIVDRIHAAFFLDRR